MHKNAVQSSDYNSDANRFGAQKAVDGSTSGNWVASQATFSCSLTIETSATPQWWKVDLGNDYEVTVVALTAREDVEQLGKHSNCI